MNPYQLLIRAVLLPFAALATLAHGEVTAITDKEGRTISVKLMGFDGTNVDVLRASDSKTFSIPFASLSDASQTDIRRWIAQGGHLTKKLEISVNPGSNRRTTAAEDFDDKRITLEPVITVKNPHATLESVPMRITILFLGRPVDSQSDLHVFRKQSFEVPGLAPLANTHFTVKPVSASYDDRGYAKFGSRYTGYIWITHDASGSEVIDSGSVPAALTTRGPARYLSLEEERTYGADFKPAVIR